MGEPDARVLRCALHGPLAPFPPLQSPVTWFQALVDLSDCCCFRSLPRLGELVDQILFERQPAQAALPLDPEILEVLPS
jgi:hypothetical protein